MDQVPRCQRTRTRRPARRPRAVCCTAARCAGAGSPSPPCISLSWRAPGHCRCSTASTSLLAAFCCCCGPNLDGRLPVGVPRVAYQRTGGGAGGSGGDARRHGFVSQRPCVSTAATGRHRRWRLISHAQEPQPPMVLQARAGYLTRSCALCPGPTAAHLCAHRAFPAGSRRNRAWPT